MTTSEAFFRAAQKGFNNVVVAAATGYGAFFGAAQAVILHDRYVGTPAPVALVFASAALVGIWNYAGTKAVLHALTMNWHERNVTRPQKRPTPRSA